jgi:hypothetical protein
MKPQVPRWYRAFMRLLIGCFGLAMTLVGIAFLATTIWPSITDPSYPQLTGGDAWTLRGVGALLLAGGPFIIHAAIRRPFGLGMDDA